MGHHCVKKVIKDFGEPLYPMDGNPTAENITKPIFCELRTLGLQISRASLWETPTGCASYSKD